MAGRLFLTNPEFTLVNLCRIVSEITFVYREVEVKILKLVRSLLYTRISVDFSYSILYIVMGNKLTSCFCLRDKAIICFAA